MAIHQAILDRLTGNDPTLDELDLGYSNLTLDELKDVIKALEKNTCLNKLDVSGNLIGDIGAEMLGSAHLPFTILVASECKISAVKALAENTRILRLDLASNDIGAAGATFFAENNTLQSLSLSGNQVGDEGATALAHNHTLISLALPHNRITEEGASALAKNTRIQRLNLNCNRIGAAGAMSLAENTALLSLEIMGNNIETLGIIALGRNRHLTALDVSYNEVNDEGAAALATHSKLVSLNVGHNQITPKGAMALGANTQLKSLVICYNLLGDEGAVALANHPALEYLDATGNQIGFRGSYAFSRHPTLTSLTLSSNKVGDTGSVVLARNKKFTELFLSYNGITDAGAIALADNITLRVLNLNYNKISEIGRQELLDSTTLKHLILSKEQPPEFSEENLDTIFLLSESFLCISDINGMLEFFNPAFTRILGYNADELLGKPIFNFIHPLDRELTRQRLLQNAPLISTYENRYRCKDGYFCSIHWTSHIKHNRLYAVGTDITELRYIAKEALRAQRASTLHQLEEAAAYSARQTEFISQLSHEIRNPLSGIYGLIESLQAQVAQIQLLVKELNETAPISLQNQLSDSFSTIEELFTDMISCARHQKEILNDNLDLVKIAEKKLVLKTDPFKLNTALKEVIAMFQAAALQKGIAIDAKMPEEAC